MKPSELRELAARQLVESGYRAEEAHSIAQDLVDAATKRLVLLVPRDDGIGFEIRSLQELMAAHAITEGEDIAVLGRLRLLAHSPHWRNTWLLAARNLLRSERFERSLVQLLRDLDNEPGRLGSRYPTAPLLAADLLEDNLAVSRPNFERALLNRLFTVLDRPPVLGLEQAARAILALARAGHRAAVFDVLQQFGATSADAFAKSDAARAAIKAAKAAAGGDAAAANKATKSKKKKNKNAGAGANAGADQIAAEQCAAQGAGNGQGQNAGQGQNPGNGNAGNNAGNNGRAGLRRLGRVG
jgi:hypothetical protein